jgi:hypothetical protein
MKNISGIIIAILIGVIGYQNGIFDKLFSKKTIDCNSEEAIKTGTQIISEKLFPKIFVNFKYNIDEIQLDTIVTKSINKDTGAQECRATAKILADFEINKNSLQEEYSFFNLLLGSDNVINLGDNKFLISSQVYYTTEITSDGEQYLVNLKFDGDRTKALYSNNITVSDEDTFKLIPNYKIK